MTAAASSTPVADAARRNDLATVKQLVRTGADVNAAQGDGLTALHWAAINDDVPMAEVLLYAGADISASTRLDGTTPLAIAAKDGAADMVKALLAHHADAGAGNLLGTTPLMLAAASGSVPAVTALLDAGADVNAKEQARGETALMYAAAYGRADVVKVLMAHGAAWKPTTKLFDWAKLPANDPRFLQFGGTGGNQAPERKTTVKANAAGKAGQKKPAPSNPFLSYPKLVGTQGGLSALLFAVRQGYTDAAEALLDGGAGVNEVDPGDGTSPLMITIINGNFDLAEKLLARGADPNLAQKNGAAPLYAVLNCVWAPKQLYPQPTAYKQQQTSYLMLMRDLLAHGAHVDARLKTDVWYSNYNFDQSGISQAGATAFWRAAYADDIDAMKLLVAHGADPTIPTIKPAGRPQTGTQGYGVDNRPKADPQAFRPCRWAGRISARCSPRPVKATAGALRPITTAMRRPGCWRQSGISSRCCTPT